MRDYLDIGPTPNDESCIGVGKPHYGVVSRIECDVYRSALIEHYGLPPGNVVLGIRAFPHDFGTYYNVVVYYNPNNEEEYEYAFMLENGLERWTTKQLAEIDCRVGAITSKSYQELIKID